ncbi:MAG TPA: glycosyltransferase family 39 protein [Anaerolineales bacterium]|nr:glycosyltransferase family 39 protein [Anaerolineales bacterium]
MNEEMDIEDWAPWLVIFIILVGGGLRLLLLDRQDVWLDEAFSVWLARQSVGAMLHWVAQIDQHPPLYYLLLHAWISLNGDTPYAVRLLSALFGAGTIPMIYLIGKRLSGDGVGLAAATLLALSPFHIRFGQEARMYTLLTFNVSVALYALVRLLTDPRAGQPIGSQFWAYFHARRTASAEPAPEGNPAPDRFPLRALETDLAWGIFIVFSAATLFTHNTAVLFPLATNLFVLGLVFYQRKLKTSTPMILQAPSIVNWGKAQIGIFLLWSPWLLTFIQQVCRVDQEFWLPAPGWNTVVQALRSFLNENTLAQANQFTSVWLMYGLVLGLGLVYYRKKFSIFLFLAMLFAVPFLGELLVSLRRPIFYDKTLIWVTLPLFLVLAAGILQFRFRFLIILGLGVLCVNNLFSAGDYYKWAQKERWSDAAGYVANFAETGDLVLFNAGWVQIPFDYYFKTYETLYLIQVEKHGIPEDMFESGILEPKMTDSDIPQLLSVIEGHHRVWLVYSHNDYTDPQNLIPQTLAAQMELTRTRDFYGGQVQLYELP